MRPNKYKNEHLDKLIEEAQKIQLKDPNQILDNLYYISVNGMVERYRELISSNLTDSSYEKAMVQIEEVQSLVFNDCKLFNGLSIELKEKFFRISNLIDVNPNNYEKHELILNTFGSVNVNHYREAAKSLNVDSESKNYALLTYTVRNRFEKKFESHLNAINKSIKESQKKEEIIQNQPKRNSKLKI